MKKRFFTVSIIALMLSTTMLGAKGSSKSTYKPPKPKASTSTYSSKPTKAVNLNKTVPKKTTVKKTNITNTNTNNTKNIKQTNVNKNTNKTTVVNNTTIVNSAPKTRYVERRGGLDVVDVMLLNTIMNSGNNRRQDIDVHVNVPQQVVQPVQTLPTQQVQTYVEQPQYVEQPTYANEVVVTKTVAKKDSTTKNLLMITFVAIGAFLGLMFYNKRRS